MQLVLAPEVAAAAAAAARRPIVARESTIVAHGLPWPDNLAVAHQLEATVRAGGATPATIAVVDGAAHVGLPAALLEELARGGARFAEAGATDLAVHLARGTSAATTVSATSLLAARAGIRVFATGGIGGEILTPIAELERQGQLAAEQLVARGIRTGDEFRFVRKHAGLRANEVAEMFGVRKETVSRWERGEVEIPRTAAFALGQLFAHPKLTRQRLAAFAPPA